MLPLEKKLSLTFVWCWFVCLFVFANILPVGEADFVEGFVNVSAVIVFGLSLVVIFFRKYLNGLGFPALICAIVMMCFSVVEHMRALRLGVIHSSMQYLSSDVPDVWLIWTLAVLEF